MVDKRDLPTPLHWVLESKHVPVVALESSVFWIRKFCVIFDLRQINMFVCAKGICLEKKCLAAVTGVGF